MQISIRRKVKFFSYTSSSFQSRRTCYIYKVSLFIFISDYKDHKLPNLLAVTDSHFSHFSLVLLLRETEKRIKENAIRNKKKKRVCSSINDVSFFLFFSVFLLIDCLFLTNAQMVSNAQVG